MTALEAIQQAQQTGKIAITKQTANILDALVRFREDAYHLFDVIEENKPDEAASLDRFFDFFYPFEDYIFTRLGETMLKGALIFNSDKDGKFEGL